MSYIALAAKHWWLLALRGLVAILFGVATLAWPGVTLGALVLLFGAFALVDGVINITSAWRASRTHASWGAYLLKGLAGILAGILTFEWPAITAIALVYLIAAWSLMIGFIEIAAAIQLRKLLAHDWLLALSGALSVLFGVVLLIAPLAGALVIALWIGIYALILGGAFIALGFRLRNRGNVLSTQAAFPDPIR